MIKEIILSHASKYPEMLPTDAVKLVYQNEFGPGHFVPDEKQAMQYLIWEMERTPSNPSLPLLEDIGNGLVRVNLAAMTEHYMTPERLNDAFVKSSVIVKGNIKSFEEKLAVLYNTVKGTEDCFNFSPEELRCYLERYSSEGYPPVSHSSHYKESYAPAYRVVLKNLLLSDEINHK